MQIFFDKNGQLFKFNNFVQNNIHNAREFAEVKFRISACDNLLIYLVRKSGNFCLAAILTH
jgi:hypothetical protein